MPCCNEITNLGCFTSCDESITLTGLIADAAGDWKVETEFAGAVVEKTFPALVGQPLTIPNVFNEDYTSIVKIFKPNGDQFGGVCYSFTVKPKVAI